MEAHLDKTIPKITSRHFKKIWSALNLLMNRVTALFRMINDAEEKDEEVYRKLTLTGHSCYRNIYESK
jgi:hypothetical protein